MVSVSFAPADAAADADEAEAEVEADDAALDAEADDDPLEDEHPANPATVSTPAAPMKFLRDTSLCAMPIPFSHSPVVIRIKNS